MSPEEVQRLVSEIIETVLRFVDDDRRDEVLAALRRYVEEES